jgi:hypothetical protein
MESAPWAAILMKTTAWLLRSERVVPRIVLQVQNFKTFKPVGGPFRAIMAQPKIESLNDWLRHVRRYPQNIDKQTVESDFVDYTRRS